MKNIKDIEKKDWIKAGCWGGLYVIFVVWVAWGDWASLGWLAILPVVVDAFTTKVINWSWWRKYKPVESGECRVESSLEFNKLKEGDYQGNPSCGVALKDWKDEWNPETNEARLPHWELAKKYNLIDFDLGVKISGAGFPVYIGQGARLQRALINFFLAEANKAGYTEIMPPTVVNQASGYGTGQLPDKEGQMYHCEVDDLYLIPTAEVPVTNIYRDVILDEAQLPVKNCAYTECFRREAGSYGKDVRGLNRLHEFSKIEIVRIDSPEHSEQSHREMLDHVEGLLKKLELPYRILRLCGGDMSFTAAICYDFEVYSQAQHRWLEVSSTSNFDTYQANRLKCRYRRNEDKKVTLCHTLNGSALALPRIVAALLENNQCEEGIRIPKALQPYFGDEMIRC